MKPEEPAPFQERDAESAPKHGEEPADPRLCDFRVACPNCGASMYDRGCKTRCPRCHYFTDCSDPW